MQGFAGFSRSGSTIRLPAQFFSELLPKIDHLGELRITLYIFWRLTLKEGDVRYLRKQEMLADDALPGILDVPRRELDDVLTDALERATARGTLLHVNIESSVGPDDYYFVNSERGRAAVDGIVRGHWRPGADADMPIDVRVERPNIFTLYEQNIGQLNPLIAEELRNAEEEFPETWIAEAIRLAVVSNARSWRYIRAILDRWQKEGRQDHGTHLKDTEKDRSKYLDYLE